jgi:hypothetical protein
VPGWPYSFVAALESGRTSWCQILDALRLGPVDDVAEVTAAQVRRVVKDLMDTGRWRQGDRDILVVLDAGYDAPRMAYLLEGRQLVRGALDDLLHRSLQGAQKFPLGPFAAGLDVPLPNVVDQALDRFVEPLPRQPEAGELRPRRRCADR